jgi:hemolysin activation/secretion protein
MAPNSLHRPEAICLTVFMGCSLALVSFKTAAQSAPDAGRILQETNPAPAFPPSSGSTIQNHLPQISRPKPTSGDVRVQVERFEFTGNSALSSAELNQALAHLAGQALDFGELTRAVEAVEARYKQAGFFLAQVYLPPQKIRDGVVEIAVNEGRLGETRLEGESRVAPDVVFGYLDQLPRHEPLTLPVLERQVLLINELAGGQTSLDLQAGDAAGTTDVVLAQKSEDALSTRLEANNYGLPSTGENRLGATLNLNGLFNRGERITLNALSSDNAGLSSYSARGDLPLGAQGLHVFGSASRAQYSLGGIFANLRASGIADSVHLGATYPFIRSRAKNLRLQVDADQSKLHDEFQASNTVLEKQSDGLTLLMSYDWLDEWVGGGSSKIDLAVKNGNLALGTAAAAQDAPPNGLSTAGGFSKVNLTLQRQQALGKDWAVSVLLMGQVASKNLDSSEKLSLGGPTSIPGYASGEANADSGYQTKLTLRWQYSPHVSLSTFVDLAELQLSVNPLASTTPNTKRLSDAGLGLDWQFDKHLSVNALLAWAQDEAPNPSDNKQPRLWINAGYGW